MGSENYQRRDPRTGLAPKVEAVLIDRYGAFATGSIAKPCNCGADDLDAMEEMSVGALRAAYIHAMRCSCGQVPVHSREIATGECWECGALTIRENDE